MSIKAFDTLYENVSLYESTQRLDTLKQKLHAIMIYFPNSNPHINIVTSLNNKVAKKNAYTNIKYNKKSISGPGQTP